MEPEANVLDRLTAETARLERQRDAAGAEAGRAAGLLQDLDARKATLAPAGSPTGRGGARELGALVAALEEEAATLSHTREVAEEAVRELDRLILEAEVRRREEGKRLARKRYETLCEERFRLDEEAEEAMVGLLEVLDRLEGLSAEQFRAADEAGNSYATQQDSDATLENWLARRLRRWLPNGSFEKYDAPLSGLDPLALSPERRGTEGRGS